MPDPFLRHKIWRAVNTDEVGEPGAFAVEAAVTAYTYGAPWLDALREYICESKQMVSDFVKEQLPQLHLVPSEATYLLWLDCGRLLEAGGKQVGVGADGGRTAGGRTDGTAAGTAAEPTAEELAALSGMRPDSICPPGMNSAETAAIFFDEHCLPEDGSAGWFGAAETGLRRLEQKMSLSAAGWGRRCGSRKAL